jgi:hypothetical protein
MAFVQVEGPGRNEPQAIRRRLFANEASQELLLGAVHVDQEARSSEGADFVADRHVADDELG